MPAVKDHIERGAVDPALPDYRDYQSYRNQGGYRLLDACLAGQHTRDEIIAILNDSGLRGLGGAGFPTGRKWEFVRREAEPRLMAVNADEGEPGTFKDRYYMETDPHRFLEGMLIGAWAVAATDIYIYLRDEYPELQVVLRREIDKLTDAGITFTRLHLRRGAGAYICGEESAMLESIEGKRGLPRHKPPFPSQVGLFGRPTLINNVETLYWVRDIVEQGPEFFSKHGRNGGTGLRSFSVSGRVKEPGVKLAPAGITVRELIDEYCGGMQEGHSFKAYLPGGASGGLLPASLGDIALDFGTLEEHGCLIGSAAVIVLSDQDQARDAALNLMAFFEHESCGQCTPCRVGTEKAVGLMREPSWDRALLDDLCTVMGGFLDLRPRTGRGQPGANDHGAFPGGSNMSREITFTLDGQEVTAAPNETIWQVADRLGTEIPHLCWSNARDYRADGNCRACMVEIEGERVLAASCVRKPTPGMAVHTASERAKTSRKLVFELLLADQPERDLAP